METEVLVIGSGFGAAAPALRLCQAGHRVLLIEKGPDIVPKRDFRQTTSPRYLQSYLKGMGGPTVSFTYAEGLGGGSGFYEMVSLRAPARAFEQRDAGGRRLWPLGVDRAALDPYYDRAERMLRVTQIPEDEVPRSGVAFSQLMGNLGYSCDRARYAVRGCMGSGFCVSGCIFGAKQSLHLNYLPQAKRAGLRVETGLEALSIRPISDGSPHRYEVRCRGTAGEVSIRARTVVLGGGTVGTAKLLLESAPFLPKLGPHVGKNIAFNGSVKAAGLLRDGLAEGDMLSGMSHPGMISYEFWESRGITISCAKPLPLTLAASARIWVRGETREPRDWGRAHVDLMKQYRRRMLVLYALGLTPPAAEIRRVGPGRFAPHLALDGALRKYHAETKALLESLFERNGCRVIDSRPTDLEGTPHDDLHFDTTHMTGSCRMADRCEDGVVDRNAEAFHHPGLYVTDGAALPGSLGVNSSLTILANAERIAEHLVGKGVPQGEPRGV